MEKSSSQGPIEDQIFKTLNSNFSPEFLEIINDSDNHSGPKGRESHFAILVVSQKFIGASRLDRQRCVFSVLSEVLPVIHALSLRALTPEEWEVAKMKTGDSFKRPECVKK